MNGLYLVDPRSTNFIKKFNIPQENPTKTDISNLHIVLQKLNLKIDPSEINKNVIGKTTQDSIKKFQTQSGLEPDGTLSSETVNKLKSSLEHVFYVGNKTRTEKIQILLERLGRKIDPVEIKSRTFGESTEDTIKQFQESVGLPADGKLNENVVNVLNEQVLKTRFTTKTQVGNLQRTLLYIGRKTKLGIIIDPKELKEKTLGSTSSAAITAFQKKYGLDVTGNLNQATYEKILSVSKSSPTKIKTLVIKSASVLSPINRVLRLNMTNKHVGELQKSLAFLGYKIEEKEFKTRTFGKTTRQAVMQYQSAHMLPTTGHVETATLKILNQDIKRANPMILDLTHSFRVRGSVRDDLWKGKSRVKVQVWEKTLRGDGNLLAERNTLYNGFFDIPYDPPRNASDGRVKSPFHLQIKVLDQTNTELDKKVLFNPTLIDWINFTAGSQPYRGISEYEKQTKAVVKVLNGISIADIEETDTQKEITYVSLNSGVSQEDVMRLALSHRSAQNLNNPVMTPEIFYAFIMQNLPPNLPSDLLGSTKKWTLIDHLVEQTVSGLIFMENDLQAQAFDNATKNNIISIGTSVQRNQILDILSLLRQSFALEKPILVGNGSLKSLLNASQIDPLHHSLVASTFLKYKDMGFDFWTDVKSNSDLFGGDEVVKDFETTVNLGYITKNYVPVLSFLKGKISNSSPSAESGIKITATRDFAKLTRDEWVSLVKENNGLIPDGTDGSTPDEKITSYASILASQSEKLFPTIAFAATVGRSDKNKLNKISEIQKFLDVNEDLDLRSTNIFKYIQEKKLTVPNDVLSQAMVLQRIHRIVPTADIGSILLDEKIHHSSGIISLGKERFVGLLKDNNVDQSVALTIFGNAEMQHALILKTISEFRFELHRANPSAIIKYGYSSQELKESFGGVPDLETLFGSQGFCDCEHCQSVYSPSAYLADIINFLDHHDSEKDNETVKDILFERRPDIGNIKLNCENTDIPLPFVDLICEILENAIAAPNPKTNFDFQTTRTQEELRAFPENVRIEAYDLLKISNYPINNSFNLWQEESRIFLRHLGINRYDLMETFQARPASGTLSPLDLSIAGEFWNMSSYETNVIVTSQNTPSKLDEFWGFTNTVDGLTSVVVSEFLQHAKIEYADLLELLDVKWINSSDTESNKLEIERPVDSCDAETQNLIHLTIDKFDKIHRFLRLWHHTDWEIWELDLLIRAVAIGNGKIDANALVQLKRIKQVQEKLGLAFETVLSLYDKINTENHVKSGMPKKIIPPLYVILFQNPVVTNPVNVKFAWPLPSSGAEKLSENKATLLAAFSIVDKDLVLLLDETDDKLNLANLTKIFRYTVLANGLKIPIKDLLTLQTISDISDIFSSPKQTLDFIDLFEWIKKSGLAIGELDYLLNYQPDSPYGLRDETVTQYIESLRESRRSNSTNSQEGQIISQIATSFSLTDEQSKLLLEKIILNGDPIMAHLADPRLIKKDDHNNYLDITQGNFQDIYTSYRLLHKASMLVTRHDIQDISNLEWFLTKYTVFSLLNFSSLPVESNPTHSLFQTWLDLYKWLYFNSQFPQPEDSSLRNVFDLATDPAMDKTNILEAISKLTAWKEEDLESLHSGLQLQHGTTSTSSDYTKIEIYIRLLNCFTQIKRISVESAMLLSWANRDVDANGEQFKTAQQIRQAAKSKYDYNAWLSIVTPLQDELREKKRNALITYLIETSLRKEQKEITFKGNTFPNPKYWKDPNYLLGYFLIDVEMGSCQLTSRLKQAMNSTQMFVQRCLLNLEHPYVEVSKKEMSDDSSLYSWKQWKWMKNYRIWEANRKVFLYPENWIEPELRDDKSQFFEQLENELQQNEITNENVESAFSHYLQNVHEVSRLEIVGVFHELDDDNPDGDNLPPSINILHVVGRTRSQPHVYYYCHLDLNYNTWSAWEKIELEITGDHVILVVYNRKLYLFWLVFTEKTQKVKKQPPAKLDGNTSDAPEPPKMLEIQLAWSYRKDGGWMPKKTSRHKLIHPWQRLPYSYNLKTRYKSQENLLWLDVYLSTSLQFNNTTFYDPYANVKKRVTSTSYDETARPWHSSSFVFDGEVIDLKMKALAGQYRILDSTGMLSQNLIPTDSYQYVHDSFGEDGEYINKLEGGYQIAPRLLLPDGMHYQNTHLTNNTKIINSNRLNVLESSTTRTLLEGAQSPFELILSQDQIQFDTANLGPTAFFYQDRKRAFFIKSEIQETILGYNKTVKNTKYLFYPFYHPYTSLFIRELNRLGLEGLLNRTIQLNPQSYNPVNNFNFVANYKPKSPNAIPDKTTESDIVDFSQYGAYSIYNWEAFFHAPLMIACRLSQNQRFEEAMAWFHYIFDPTNTEALGAPQRYWITKPFFEQNSEDYRKQRIANLLENIDTNVDQVTAWKNNPFKPHLIARFRPVAYQKTVVMKYIDNLIAWGDQLFRSDTIESINEAIMLYVLAYELLGPRPVKIPNVEHADFSYNELVADGALDIFGNKKVEVLAENFIYLPKRVIRTPDGTESLPKLDVSYFCLPSNDNLLEYWNTVEDRLFKIHHCMNIEGVVRQLPLFEPPIDPALLVKATAAGVDIGSVLSDMAGALQGQYRFRILVQKALEFCNEVKSLGEKLLSVLEKNDAEGLTLLRSVNEMQLLDAITEVKRDQIKEAQDTWDGLQKGIEVFDKKIEYYSSIPRMNDWEIAGVVAHGLGIGSEIAATVSHLVAGAAHLFPQIKAGVTGVGGSPTATVEIGGKNVGDSSTDFAALFQGLASILHQGGQMLEAQGGYQRRDDENKFQNDLAIKEQEQLQKQVSAAEIRHSITEQELQNHELQIEQTKSIDEYMHNKYTNQQLYNWMLKQLATTYFQSYSLAYDMAKRAEKHLQFELGISDTSFIQFGYWDSLKKGLLAGDKLSNDIRRMETAYYDEHTRELEITKHVSLSQFAPLKLLTLKETGSCTMVLPEWLFDMDYPGHYRRRIKSVSITIPCIVGPFTSVNCTLSLTGNGIRIKDDITGDYGDPLTTDDAAFIRNPVPIELIATSHGQNDAGMFELNFNDERYLPFEGAGVVSQWQIDLPKENNQFDFMSISDVILHIKYTSVEGKLGLINAAKANLKSILPTSGLRLFSLKNEFSSEWYRFLNPATGADQELIFTLKPEHLPFYIRAMSTGKKIILSSVDLILEGSSVNFDINLRLPGVNSTSDVTITPDTNFGGMPHLIQTTTIPSLTNVLGDWVIKMKKNTMSTFKSLTPEDVKNAYLVVSFKIQ